MGSWVQDRIDAHNAIARRFGELIGAHLRDGSDGSVFLVRAVGQSGVTLRLYKAAPGKEGVNWSDLPPEPFGAVVRHFEREDGLPMPEFEEPIIQ